MYDMCEATSVSILTNSQLNAETRAIMFDMYAKSYTNAGQQLWFKTAEEMFRSSCSAMVHIDGGKIVSFALFQQRPRCNKISLVAHDQTARGRLCAIKLRDRLCRTDGWFLEASGAPAWILRSKYATPYVENVEDIKLVLDIPESENIVLNPKFEADVDLAKNGLKEEGFYFHEYYSSKDQSLKLFSNPETLFGTAHCNTWSNGSCQRQCADAT